MFCLVLGTSVGKFSEPIAGCVSGWDRCPWEGKVVRLAAGQASISLILTEACTVRHFFTVCHFEFRIYL